MSKAKKNRGLDGGHAREVSAGQAAVREIERFLKISHSPSSSPVWTARPPPASPLPREAQADEASENHLVTGDGPGLVKCV